MTANKPTRPPASRRAGLTLASTLAVVCAAGLVASSAPARTPFAGASAGKTTAFVGRIVSGRGRYARLRGLVRLVLRSSAASPPPFPGRSSTTAFGLDVRAPSCAGRARPGPHRCVSLKGAIRGTATGTRANPDVGASFELTGHGLVGPLGRVVARATTHGLGFIAHGRFRMDLELRNGAGAVVIVAAGPLVPGFRSPF